MGRISGGPLEFASRVRLGEAGIQEKRVAIDEMWFNRLGEVLRWPRVATTVATEAPLYGGALGPKNGRD